MRGIPRNIRLDLDPDDELTKSLKLVMEYRHLKHANEVVRLLIGEEARRIRKELAETPSPAASSRHPTKVVEDNVSQ